MFSSYSGDAPHPHLDTASITQATLGNAFDNLPRGEYQGILASFNGELPPPGDSRLKVSSLAQLPLPIDVSIAVRRPQT